MLDRDQSKAKLCNQKTVNIIINHHTIISLFNIFLPKREMEILKLGYEHSNMTYHLTFDISSDISSTRLSENYSWITIFVIKLDENKSIAKNALIFKPKTNKNHKLETICKNFSETKINIQRISDNIHNFRDGLNLLMKKIR